MNRTKLGAWGMLALASCATAQERQPLTTERFEAAKKACGAADAYLLEAQGRRGIGFRGVATDFNARQVQAQCLRDKLKDTDVDFIGFLSKPPPQ